MTVKEIRAEIRTLKSEMKAAGIKKTSCFNGGLTPETYRYNARLFELDVWLKNAIARESAVRG